MPVPRQEGEPSFELYEREKTATLSSLKRRAELLVGALNRLEGVTCNAAEGALYAFPRITLPDRAIQEAKRIGEADEAGVPGRFRFRLLSLSASTTHLFACNPAGKSPDWLYCRELLDEYGIVVVPGSGFGQADGTYHFRTTFLPSEDDIGLVVENLSSFHAGCVGERIDECHNTLALSHTNTQ